MPVLASYTALAVGLFSETWKAPTTRVIGSYGDPLTSVWFMRWFAFSLVRGLNPFLTDYVNFPQGYNLMWNTPMPLVGWILAPATLAGGPVLTYNIVITASLALSAFAAFLVFRRYIDHALAAAVGGLVYGFSPYMVIQAVGHWHVIMAVTPPLMLLLLDEIVVRDRRSPIRLGVLLGLVSVIQLLLGEEILTSEVLIATVGVAILAVLYRRQARARVGRVAKALAVAAAVALPIAAYPLWVQFVGPNRLTGVIQPPNVYVTDLLNLVVPTDFQWLAPPSALAVTNQFTGNGSEWNGYLGAPLVLVAVFVAIRYWRDPLVRFMALLGAATAVLSLGPHLHIGGRDTPVRLPYLVVDHLPLVGNLLPSRLALYVSMAAAFLLAVLLDRLLRSEQRLSRAAAVACVLVVLAPLVPRLPYRDAPTNTPAFFINGGADRIPDGSVALVAPFGSLQSGVGPTLWQAESGFRFRMAEGYFFTAGRNGAPRLGPEPFPLSQRMLAIFDGTAGAEPLTAVEVEQYREDLRSHRIDVVIVGPMLHQDAMVQLFTQLTGRTPDAVDGVSLWQDVRSR